MYRFYKDGFFLCMLSLFRVVIVVQKLYLAIKKVKSLTSWYLKKLFFFILNSFANYKEKLLKNCEKKR